MVRYVCHDCEATFDVAVDNDHGTYEFRRCPECGGARTTLSSA